MKVVFFNQRALPSERERQQLIASLKHAYSKDIQKSYKLYKNDLDKMGVTEAEYVADMELLAMSRILEHVN